MGFAQPTGLILGQLEGELSGEPLLQEVQSLDKDRAIELPAGAVSG